MGAPRKVGGGVVMADEPNSGPGVTGSGWLERLADSRDAWEIQRVLMETQVAAFAETAYARAGQNPVILTLVDAQCEAMRKLFAARATAAESLFISREAETGFRQVAGSHAADNLQPRLLQVAKVLLDAQADVADTLLAAQTSAREILNMEQSTRAATLLSVQSSAADKLVEAAAAAAGVLSSRNEDAAKALLAAHASAAKALELSRSTTVDVLSGRDAETARVLLAVQDAAAEAVLEAQMMAAESLRSHDEETANAIESVQAAAREALLATQAAAERGLRAEQEAGAQTLLADQMAAAESLRSEQGRHRE
jgi:hypothetical protein